MVEREARRLAHQDYPGEDPLGSMVPRVTAATPEDAVCTANSHRAKRGQRLRYPGVKVVTQGNLVCLLREVE